jgi:Protein of unknown function (DUF4240)
MRLPNAPRGRRHKRIDDNEFWATIEESHAASGGDMDRKDQLIKAAINRLTGDEALAFYQIFTDKWIRPLLGLYGEQRML